MTQILVLAMQVVLGGGGPCHLVTNTQILILPSCDVSPATIEELTPDPGLAAHALSAGLVGPGNAFRRGAARAPPPMVVPLSAGELQRRLEVSEADRVSAVAERVSLEHERDVALRERDAARRALRTARNELEALRAAQGCEDRSVKASVSAPPPVQQSQ
jgi:hypothetical protein